MRAALVSIALLAAAPVAANDWDVVPAQSSLGFGATWNGQAVEGKFPKFAATIRFDPAKLAEARIDVVIDMTAATTTDKTVNSSLPGPDWFDVKKYPTARFTSTSVTQVKPGQYVAKGTLSLKGVAAPVSLPFTLAIKGNSAVMAGQTTVDRRSFKIGMESDAGGDWVAFPVPIKVRITATRKP